MRSRSVSPKPPEETAANRLSQITISEEISNIPRDMMKDEADAPAETAATLASMINYFQTTPVLNYNDPPFLMHSGSELKIDKIITNRSREFIRHTARNIIRVYPEIQTAGIEMQMNQTLFEENGQCGYVRKAKVLSPCHDKHILVANRLEISVKSSQLLNLLVPMKGHSITTSVRVDLYDLPHDTVVNGEQGRMRSICLQIIGKFRTAPSTSDGYNTHYLENRFVFKKVIKPEHALLHIRVMDENDEEIGQRFLVVHKLQSGYRHILLRNKYNQSEGPASVFVHIRTSIYEELRERYVDPLKQKNERQKERDDFTNPFGRTERSKRKDSRQESTQL
ncbi:hypothetical protein M3Y99_00028200 [Aphelenchoides fujianensis]|nr:hypothetical protein M3Y99_00028200 [Aphelenchoides fujianensis]